VLDELVSLLILSRPVLTCVPAMTSTPPKVQASLVGTRYSVCMTDSPLLSPMRETPPPMGEPVVASPEVVVEDVRFGHLGTPRHTRPLGALHGFRGGAGQAKVVLNQQSTKVEVGNQKAPTN
jgi:hypothetical protein